MESDRLLYDHVFIDGPADVAISVSREAGLDAAGDPLNEPLAGNMLPRLCQFAGQGACAQACQAPEGYTNQAKDCATQSGHEFFRQMGVSVEDVRLGKVCGGANVAFVDQNEPARNSEGYVWYPDVDAVVGYGNTVKACRLADCGLLVVTGTSQEGRLFDGFIHATRNNLNGNDQFVGADGQPVGGVTKMLNDIWGHYRPLDMHVELVAGIAPKLYLFDFTPTEQELHDSPQMTAESKREALFKGWHEREQITPHIPTGQEWDGKTYQVNMIAAIRDQVAAAGLADRYSENVRIDGNLVNGHASNRGGKAGAVAQARDMYAVVPYDYYNLAI